MAKRGALAALTAYVLWGLFPIFWKQLQAVPAPQLLAHRIVWSFLLLIGIGLWRRKWGWWQQARRSWRLLATFMLSVSLLSTNWLIYIWAVNANYVVDASLGYFINPLVNVLLGMLFLKERLRKGQALSILLAAAGVLYLAFSSGVQLWIGLVLASTFGLYGLMRKTAVLGSIDGLSLEMSILVFPAALYLLAQELLGVGAFGHLSGGTSLILFLTGMVTVIPLLLFAYGAQQIPLTTLGLLQYVAPTMQFLVGVYLYGEPLPPARLLGFGIIWLALLIYWVEGSWQARRKAGAVPA